MVFFCFFLMIWFFTGLSFSHKQTTHPYTRMSDMYLEMSSCYGAEGVKSFCSHPYSWKCPIFPSSSVSENLSLCFKQSKCSHFSLEGAALLSLSFVCELSQWPAFPLYLFYARPHNDSCNTSFALYHPGKTTPLCNWKYCFIFSFFLCQGPWKNIRNRWW